MTPAELITRRLSARILTAGVSLPVQSLLIQALEGEKKSVASSGVLISVSNPKQLTEPLTNYEFDVSARLVVAIDDDKSGLLFAENYNAMFAAMHHLAAGDNCTELGDEDDVPAEGETITHVFACDGFQLNGGNEPDYEEDNNGGTWTTSFTATLTGRAN